MTQKPKVPIWLTCEAKAFPGDRWRNYLKAFTVDRKQTRSTEVCHIWNPLLGPGFVVWISWPHIWHSGGKMCWRIIIESPTTLNEAGQRVLSELLRGIRSCLPEL